MGARRRPGCFRFVRSACLLCGALSHELNFMLDTVTHYGFFTQIAPTTGIFRFSIFGPQLHQTLCFLQIISQMEHLPSGHRIFYAHVSWSLQSESVQLRGNEAKRTRAHGLNLA